MKKRPRHHHFNRLIFIIPALLLILTVFYAASSSAIEFTNPVPATSVPGLAGKIIKNFLGIVGSIALALFVYAGATWLIAKGDSGKIKSAIGIMTWAGIGLVVIFFSYAILNFVFDII
ncbi:MAG TPA: hypothetical protein PKZ16_00325 [bacterium]|nr:hypothetical protein [bacterium]HPL95667.1 hypothetical protein [bacterium]